jgi:hypothetical protein
MQDRVYAPACLSAARANVAGYRFAACPDGCDGWVVARASIAADTPAMPSYAGARPEQAAVVDWSRFLFGEAGRLLHHHVLPSLVDEGLRILLSANCQVSRTGCGSISTGRYTLS